jgi:hypothetical protein
VSVSYLEEHQVTRLARIVADPSARAAGVSIGFLVAILGFDTAGSRQQTQLKPEIRIS